MISTCSHEVLIGTVTEKVVDDVINPSATS